VIIAGREWPYKSREEVSFLACTNWRTWGAEYTVKVNRVSSMLAHEGITRESGTGSSGGSGIE